MAENRGPISSYVGKIPIANSYYSGDITKMTEKQLRARLAALAAADPRDEDADEAFENRTDEIDNIRAELKRRQGA